ncbi:MAG TPA: hypothetical protein VK769_03815 [Verrucomicrobiae bacterium]|jgi:hypothetical protein|nr:hypothetical protein [Verrucomicrobiae bacterium]
MKKMIKYSNSFGFVMGLCLMVIFGCSCSAPKPTPDPLAGFHQDVFFTPDTNKAITDDYKSYIQTLSPEEQKFATVDEFFADGTGQHAVRIETDINGDQAWYHILIYDKDNKRIKVIKYYRGKYMS